MARTLLALAVMMGWTLSGPAGAGATAAMAQCVANLTMPAAFGRAATPGVPPSQGNRPNILFILSDQQVYAARMGMKERHEQGMVACAHAL